MADLDRTTERKTGRNRLCAGDLRKRQPGRYGDGGGLYLVIRRGGGERLSRIWAFRYVSPHRLPDGGPWRRDMGLGSAEQVPLADARRRRDSAVALINQGLDPLVERDRERETQIAEAEARRVKAEAAQRRQELTLEAVARKMVVDKAPTWKHPARATAQFIGSLERHAFPAIGRIPIVELTADQVRQVVEPLWGTKTETANRVRSRIEAVLEYAARRTWLSFPSGRNPAARSPLGLEAAKRVTPVRSRPAATVREANSVLVAIRRREGSAARALEFSILTAMRIGAVVDARREEVDLASKCWTIPSERMKGLRAEHGAAGAFKVPLSPAAVALVGGAVETDSPANAFLFPGLNGASGVHSNAVSKLMREMAAAGEIPKVTPHGWRATFKTWGAETGEPTDLIEVSLAHVLPEVTRAYLRGDILERRRELLERWASFLAGEPARASRESDAENYAAR